MFVVDTMNPQNIITKNIYQRLTNVIVKQKKHIRFRAAYQTTAFSLLLYKQDAKQVV
jgi:hypothetical protein